MLPLTFLLVTTPSIFLELFEFIVIKRTWWKVVDELLLQGYNEMGLLGPIIFYTENKPQCYLVCKGSNWYLHKMCCSHGKLQGEILSPLRPVGNSEEFEGIMIHMLCLS